LNRISGKFFKLLDVESGKQYAEVAHLVEHDLAKVGVAGSSPVFRSAYPSSFGGGIFFEQAALVVELVDTQDLKSCGQQWP
jgi:hypothetical protein